METILKKLILSIFLLVILSIGIIFNLETSDISESLNPNLDNVGLTLLALYFINLYFLYNLKPFSRHLFLFLVLFSVAFEFIEPTNYNRDLLGDNLINIIIYIWTIIEGMIIGLIFFSDLKKKFLPDR